MTPGLQPVKPTGPIPSANWRSLILLLSGRRRRCRVDGDSMRPTLAANDVVIFQPIHADNKLLKMGCVVVARHPLQPAKLIIKRLVAFNSNGLELRGDNEPASTDSRHFGLVPRNQLLGIAECVISSARRKPQD